MDGLSSWARFAFAGAFLRAARFSFLRASLSSVFFVLAIQFPGREIQDAQPDRVN